jgi:short-subunit dehydrogenase
VQSQHIWLVGASEGIGEALALQLAASGAKLTLSARNRQRLEQVATRLAGSGHAVQPLDVTDAASVAACWQAFGTQLPDMVIYNAGAYKPMDARHIDLAAVETMVDVNLRGALRVVSHVAEPFAARGHGRIVLVASIAGYCGLPAAIGYGASKAGLIHLAENLKADLARYGVLVQVVNPGFVKTRLTDQNDFPMPSILTPEVAARHIARGLRSTKFEIRFPWGFSTVLKLASLLPYRLYFRLLSYL